MTTHEAFLKEGPPTKFDNTIATTFEQCPRKFYWWRRGFTYAGENKPPYFTFGSAWGVMQGAWHLSPGPHSSPHSPEWELALLKAVQRGLLYWDLSKTQSFGVDSRENLEILFRRYVEEYALEPWRMVEGGAEKGFLYPLEGTPYYLGGSLDGQLEWEGMGQLFKEDKTTGGYLTDKYFRSWEFSNQTKGYSWYGKKLYGDDFFGILMDMASKRITKSGKTPLFGRILLQFKDQTLLEFEKDWLERIHRIEDTYEKGYFPRTTNPYNCSGGPGLSTCLFQNVCLSDAPYEEVNPTQFDSIEEKDEEWAPWDWEDPAKELDRALREREAETIADDNDMVKDVLKMID